jgi:2-oxoglutarate ferredoxin oxidoreductase subunit beta
MSTETPTPVPAPSGKKTNRLGLELSSYRGSKTTLCAGCGHNAITSASSTRVPRWAWTPRRC